MATKKIEREPMKHGARYPWETWFRTAEKRSVRLVRGTHFSGKPHGMSATARQAAGRLGVASRISISVGDDYILISPRKN